MSSIVKDGKTQSVSTGVERRRTVPTGRFIHALFFFLLLCIFHKQPWVSIFIKMPFSTPQALRSFPQHLEDWLSLNAYSFLGVCSGTPGLEVFRDSSVACSHSCFNSWLSFSPMSVIHIYRVLSSSIKFYLVPRVDWSLSALQPNT